VAVAFGPYLVFEPLGMGGMASVFRAEIDVAGAAYVVALKCLSADLANDKTFVRRFIAEARLGQLLKHPNIARTHEVGCIDHTHFIAFEYVPGFTLLEILRHASEAAAPPIHVTLRIVSSIARALAYAHDLRDEQNQPIQLIHRDIAPSNVIVADTGVTKLIDFGVAKSSFAHVNTAVGQVIGKLGYVAPEYLRTGKLDARADLYSLGVIAYEMLTAERLFDAETIDGAEAERAARIPPPSQANRAVPPELDQIVMKALEPRPAARWSTAYELHAALEAFITGFGLGIEDGEVADWVRHELGPVPARRPPRLATADIAIDVESGVDAAFARVRLRTEPSG
jgi:eukaryotic-like serine/threonine-protein kinase